MKIRLTQSQVTQIYNLMCIKYFNHTPKLLFDILYLVNALIYKESNKEITKYFVL